jgi:sugar lactone lactonase YvrE
MTHAQFARFVVVVGVVTVALSGAAAYAQVNEEVNAGRAPYTLDEHFFSLPEGRTIGSTAGITLDRDGRSIWTFDRCADQLCVGSDLAPIQKFDADGNLLQSFGAGLFLRPHGIHIDKDGNVWVTDAEGPNGEDPRRDGRGHQVFKFSPEGELLMTLGTAGVAGDGPDQFNMPSAVFIAPNGDIFIGDGHGGASNARMLKFASDGTFIKTWGKPGTGPGDFELPHGIAMDSRGRLFVGDRGNGRVQIFDQDGNFLEEWKQFGRPSGIFIDRNDMLYVADHTSDAQTNPGWKEGIRIGSVTDGKVIQFIPDPDGDGSQEGIAVDLDGDIYGSLTSGMALRRWVKP